MARRIKLIWYNKNWYHPNFFKKQRKACLEEANYTCQECGKKQGDTYTSRRGRESKVVIQIHHPNNDRENPNAILVALCKSCHLKADGHIHGKKQAQTKKRKAVQAQIDAGQLMFNWEFEEPKRRKKVA